MCRKHKASSLSIPSHCHGWMTLAGIFSVKDVCRKHGISGETFYKWRAGDTGLEVSDVKKIGNWKKKPDDRS